MSDLLPNSVKITIFWKYPDEVTKSVVDKDSVKINIIDSSIFIDHATGEPYDFKFTLNKEVPKIIPSITKKRIDFVKEKGLQPLSAFLFIQVILGSPFLPFFIQYLWGFINGLQIMVLIVLFIDNQMPRNLNEVLGQLF